MSLDVDQRVLVLAPRGRDASVIAQILDTVPVKACADITELARSVSEGAGAAMVTEEALVGQALEALTTWITEQQPWSDLPVIVLAAQRIGPRPLSAQKALADLGNVVILERPVNGETLQRGVASALRARRRQYVAREHLEERSQFASLLERRIGESTAELEQTNARLTQEMEEKDRMHAILIQSQKMEAVGQLTGGVAHDFNNLLTIIRSSVDFLSRDNVPEARRARYVEAISQTVDRATKLTGQLLAFARRQTLTPVDFNVGAQVESVADLVRPLVGARVAIEVRTPPELCYAKADISQFETALINLAVNGRDAMHGEGTLTFTVEPLSRLPSIRGHAGSEGAFVCVTVEDSGTGIAADHLSSIFEPFFTTKEVGKGTGLGLSQVFGFAKQSGGEVAVRSEEGRGAAFELYLPRTQGEPAGASGPAATQTERSEMKRGLRVLVVEDNEAVGRFAIEMLKDLGHRPMLANNAREALEILEGDTVVFDAVFSDVMMPGVSGLVMAQMLRERFANLPVLLTSGYSHVIAEEGAHGFELLKKPYSVEALAQRLQQVVSAAR